MKNARIVSLIGIWFAASAAALAKLEFEQTSLFVTPEKGAQTVSGDFKLTNTGDTPVNILEIITSCGCTTATLSRKRYEPKESGAITAIFTIGKREGRQSKAVVVRTDEAAANEYLLKFETEIEPMVSVEPRAVFWKHDDPTKTKPIAIAYASAGQVKLVGAEAASGAFQVEIAASTDLSGSKVFVTPESTTKSVQGRLVLQFEAASGGKIERFVMLRVLPDTKVADAYRAPASPP